MATRLLGKRLSGQLAILGIGVMITIGAIVSAPIGVAASSASRHDKGRHPTDTSSSKLERACIEALGLYSIVQLEDAKPGLPVLPDAERKALSRLREASGEKACQRFGSARAARPGHARCPACHETRDTPASRGR